MKIAYEAMDGHVHVLGPVLKGLTLEEWVAAHGHAIPAGARNVTLVGEVPEERSDRSMWAIEDGKIVVRGRPASPPILDAFHPLEQKLRASIEALEQPPVPERQPWSLKDLMRRAEEDAPAVHQTEDDAPLSEPALPSMPLPAPPEASPQTDFSPPASEPVEMTPAPLSIEPAPEPLPYVPALPEPPLIEDHRASDVIVTDAERKRQAIERVSFAVARVGDGQIRYEIAVQADNGNTDALEMLQTEASIYRMPVSALAKQIIAQRALQEQRVMRAYAAKAQALMVIENAAGADIDDVAEAYVQKIMEEGNAGAS